MGAAGCRAAESVRVELGFWLGSGLGVRVRMTLPTISRRVMKTVSNWAASSGIQPFGPQAIGSNMILPKAYEVVTVACVSKCF